MASISIGPHTIDADRVPSERIKSWNKPRRSTGTLEDIDRDLTDLDHWIHLLNLETARYVMFNRDGSTKVLDQRGLNEVTELRENLEDKRAKIRSIRAELVELFQEIEKETGTKTSTLNSIESRLQRYHQLAKHQLVGLGTSLNRLICGVRIGDKLPSGQEILMSPEIRNRIEDYDFNIAQLQNDIDKWSQIRNRALDILQKYPELKIPPAD